MHKIVITGGHLSPALSVIEVLPKDFEVLIIGRKQTFEGDKNLSFEYQTAKTLGITFRAITTGRLQRTFTRYSIWSLIKFPIGILQAVKILRDFKPNIILSFGGYVSLPVVLVGAMQRIPIVIHEQTLSSGLSNRLGSLLAKKVCLSWEQSRKYFPASKTVLTGNPIRPFTIYHLPFTISNEKLPLIYITGGSSGSHTVNMLIEACLDHLLKKYKIIHQTGDSWDFGDFDRLQKLRESLDHKIKNRYVLTKFVSPQDVGSIIKSADLVISRAGINTITELIYFGKPALLIPLNSEQMENAIFMKSQKLAEIISQDANSESLYAAVEKMMKNLKNYSKNAKEGQALIKKDAAFKIVAVIKSTIRN